MPTKIIKLDTGIEVEIPANFEYSKCKGCDADDVIWAKTKSGKNMPVRYDNLKGWISHFSDCPKAKEFRKDKNEKIEGVGFVSNEELIDSGICPDCGAILSTPIKEEREGGNSEIVTECSNCGATFTGGV